MFECLTLARLRKLPSARRATRHDQLNAMYRAWWRFAERSAKYVIAQYRLLANKPLQQTNAPTIVMAF